jgi:hypothetical protein
MKRWRDDLKEMKKTRFERDEGKSRESKESIESNRGTSALKRPNCHSPIDIDHDLNVSQKAGQPRDRSTVGHR